MKNYLTKYIPIAALVVAFSCTLNDLDNPNTLPAASADSNSLLTSVELTFTDFFNNIQGIESTLVRQNALTGGYRYQTALPPQNFDGVWQQAYQQTLNNIATLKKQAVAGGLTRHLAIAEILEGYIYITLVDAFGNVPETEALNAQTNFNPKSDNASDVYKYAIGLLRDARVQLGKTPLITFNSASDIFFAGSVSAWTRVSNTIELKSWINIQQIPARATEATDSISKFMNITTGASIVPLIEEPESLPTYSTKNFTYQYGTATVPNSRHPLYNQYYGPGLAQASGYINNYFLKEMYNGMGVQDPRWRYYFFRQVGSIYSIVDPGGAWGDPSALGCTQGAIPAHYSTGGYVYCSFDPGFFGRDHGDASGTPPDSPVLTTAGGYPAGGRLDNGSTANADYWAGTQRGQGANGAGIEPIWMSFFTPFLKAEVLMRNGQTASARVMLLSGVKQSIDQVRAFCATRNIVLTATEPDNAAYISSVGTAFDDATNPMDIIGKEYWKALWGNGIEAYNLYRRTSAPRNPQPMRQLNPGPFFRSMVYPANFVNLNPNTAQKDVNQTNKVFWDNNPDDLQ